MPLPLDPGADPFPAARGYIALAGVQGSGPDLADGVQSGATLPDCIDTCDNIPGCAAVVYFDGTGLCITKQGLDGQPQLTAGVSTHVANTGALSSAAWARLCACACACMRVVSACAQ